MNSKPTPQQILSTPMSENDAHADTIGQYLATLTRTVWYEGEGFSGKRPFGNSGWKGEIAHALILNKILDGELDEYGLVEDYNDTEFHNIMDSVFTLLENADHSTIALPPVPKDHYVVRLDYDRGLDGALVDFLSEARTKADAQIRAEQLNDGENDLIWKVIHIPA